MWTTVAIFCAALAWAIVGKVDIIASAEGKIIPGGRVRVIQPLDKGMIKRILVNEGQQVKAGQPLVELDQTQLQADKLRYENDLHFTQRKVERRGILYEALQQFPEERLTLQRLREDDRLFDNPEDIGLLHEEWLRLTSDADTLMSQLGEREAELRTCQVLVRQYTATLPIAEDRAAAGKALYEQNVTSRFEYLSLEEERLRQVHALEAEKTREEQLQAAVVSMESQLAATRAKALAEVSMELDDLRRQERSLQQDLAKLRDMDAKQILASPVDGTVKDLNVYTVGGVVNEAERLMEIVPLGERLEVEAFVGNQDIGYIHEGQSAEVKIHTFPFTRYGVIAARVESVARDATVDEKLGLIYRATLSLEESAIMVDGRETPLLPGMAVTAEISTGQRRLIEFFLAPLLRMRQESMRER
jgi:hemolysin D